MEEQEPESDTEMEEVAFSLPVRRRRAPLPSRAPSRTDEAIAAEDEWRWAVAQAFFDHRGLVTDHISSYNTFVESGIHEMFGEAEPFEVDPPEEERASKKRVRITFGDVELEKKPEMPKEDRAFGRTDGKKSSARGAGKSKGVGSEKGKASWFANADESEKEKASSKESKGKGSWLADTDAPEGSGAGSLSQKGKREANCGNSQDGSGSEEEDAGPRKGKGKYVPKYNLHEVLHPDGNDNDSGLGKDFEEPPKISQETWGLEDGEEDAPAKSAGIEDMDTEFLTQSHAGKAKDRPVHDNSTPPSSPEGEEGEEDGPNGTAWRESTANGDYSGNPDVADKRRRCKPNVQLLPVEARLRGMTYASPIFLKVTITTLTVDANKQKGSSKSSSASSSRGIDTREERVLLGSIPVMVKSSLCHLSGSKSEKAISDNTRQFEMKAGKDRISRKSLNGDCCLDPGGYFIIKGSEKVLVAQEERNMQRIWVSCLKGVWMASCTPRRKGFAQYNYHRTIVKLGVPKKSGLNQGGVWPLVTVNLPGVEPLPMGVVFAALGVPSDREILEMICYNSDDAELLQAVCPSLLDSAQALKKASADWNNQTFANVKGKRQKEVALFYIGSKTYGRTLSDKLVAQDVLDVRLLPHIKSKDRGKALFLGYMVRTVVLCFLGRQKGTDRDDFKNKRLEFAGEIISHQFRKLMGQVVNTMKKRIQKHLSKGVELQAVEKYLDEKIITRGLKVAFSSGNWKGHDTLKNSGIVFDLKRGNPISTLCQLRELRHFVPPTVRVGDDARHPTFSQWGRVCPIDTPDGEACGLVKNMALTGMVSRATPEKPVLKLLEGFQMEALESVMELSSLQDAVKVFVNGRWVGILGTRDADRFLRKLRSERRRGPASGADLTEVEVVQDSTNQELHISTDSGRVLRPLLIVKDQTLVLNEDHVSQRAKHFEWLLREGVVELLGIEEEEKAMIAVHGEDIVKAKVQLQGGRSAPKFTHAELHPSLILGLSASLIPFPNRNQSSRNLFQAHKHSKQAIGFYVTNINSRADTAGQHLFYPQVQLVKTNTFDCLKKPEMFSGQNAIVAIACYTGYNQEDSIIMNQSSLDRGMFRTTHYRTVRTEEKSDYETFGKPNEVDATGAQVSRSIEKLDDDGLPGVGSNLGVGDVIVGKISKIQNVNTDSARVTDPSQRLKAHEKGSVEQVVLVQDEDGNNVVKVKLRETRMPQVGDKFSSMHGQKGIVGMVFTQEDLPFTSEGIVPDIVINPHAFPSRQTLGQMYESALGKVVAKTGERIFATPFNPLNTLESISDALQKAGYERWGNETLYNSENGQPIEASIFIGTTFYQRLTHMVEDKIKYRSRGHVHPLTRQPVADRKRHGGVKFGEMERDCLIGHGASATLQERSFILSDFHTVHVCTRCEQLAHCNSDRVPTCLHCTKDKNGQAIVKIELPYACKLLMQELMSMGISVRLKTERM